MSGETEPQTTGIAAGTPDVTLLILSHKPREREACCRTAVVAFPHPFSGCEETPGAPSFVVCRPAAAWWPAVEFQNRPGLARGGERRLLTPVRPVACERGGCPGVPVRTCVRPANPADLQAVDVDVLANLSKIPRPVRLSTKFPLRPSTLKGCPHELIPPAPCCGNACGSCGTPLRVVQTDSHFTEDRRRERDATLLRGPGSRIAVRRVRSVGLPAVSCIPGGHSRPDAHFRLAACSG